MGTILIVEDEPDIAELVRYHLEKAGLPARIVADGKQALELIARDQPDLIVLDMMMPEIDGWAVCREVRSFSSVPIIVLSALNDPSVIASILDAGADDYLTKPAPSRLLLAHIKKLVRRSVTGGLSLSTPPALGLSPKTSPTAP